LTFNATLWFNQSDIYQGYWILSPGTNAPAAATIQACTDANLCGNFTLMQPNVTLSKTVTSGSLTIGTSYTLYVVFYNMVPGATLASTVTSVYTFTPQCPTGQTVQNGVCTATVAPTPTNGTNTTATSTIAMSLTTLIAMNVLLFN